jgi:ABC-type iron transport system FetAB ATPase subunit
VHVVGEFSGNGLLLLYTTDSSLGVSCTSQLYYRRQVPGLLGCAIIPALTVPQEVKQQLTDLKAQVDRMEELLRHALADRQHEK